MDAVQLTVSMILDVSTVAGDDGRLMAVFSAPMAGPVWVRPRRADPPPETEPCERPASSGSGSVTRVWLLAIPAGIVAFAWYSRGSYRTDPPGWRRSLVGWVRHDSPLNAGMDRLMVEHPIWSSLVLGVALGALRAMWDFRSVGSWVGSLLLGIVFAAVIVAVRRRRLGDTGRPVTA